MFAGPMCRRLRPTVLASPILRTIRAASTPRPRALETHVASLLSSSSVRLYPTRSGEHRKRPVKHLSSQQKLAWQLPHGWEAVIGVECHAQIKGPTKLFSATPLPTPQSQHNTLVSPYDAAHPGTLPLLQRTAVDKALRAALILHCEVVEVSRFDRKHYFYPDLTMGYQITQKYVPFAKNGYIHLRHDEGHLPLSDPEIKVQIEQMQLEQDTAKSSHLAIGDSTKTSDTYVDLNRSGVGLMEIVSGPQIQTPAQAGAYVRKLQELLRRVGASDGNMDEGSLRCDVNVSIRPIGSSELGTRCEVKNINSTRFVERAIASEVIRQYEIISQGDIIEQQTRCYDEHTGKTNFLRSKEDAPDYRYMPDPNLPALKIRARKVEQVAGEMPEHPDDQRRRLIEQYGLTVRDVNVLMRIGLEEENAASHNELAPLSCPSTARSWRLSSPGEAVQYFELIVKNGRQPKTVANWILHELLRILKLARAQHAQKKHWAGEVLASEATFLAPRPEVLGELIDLVEAGRLTATSAKSLLPYLCQEAKSTDQGGRTNLRTHILDLATSRGIISFEAEAHGPQAPGLSQSSSDESGRDSLISLCGQVIADLPKEAAKVRAGKEKVVMRMVGEVMKRSKGQADGKRAKHVLLDLISGVGQ